jgi:hypothetical protein
MLLYIHSGWGLQEKGTIFAVSDIFMAMFLTNMPKIQK